MKEKNKKTKSRLADSIIIDDSVIELFKEVTAHKDKRPKFRLEDFDNIKNSTINLFRGINTEKKIVNQTDYSGTYCEYTFTCAPYCENDDTPPCPSNVGCICDCYTPPKNNNH